MDWEYVMRTSIYRIWIMLLIVFSGSASASDDLDGFEISRVFENSESERLILVGFGDSNIKRSGLLSMADPYRKRGRYNGSTWSKRIVSQISEEYNLKMLTDWPMTEIGIHCVVFRIPESASIANTIGSLNSDKRIGVVQRMHLFEVKGESQYRDPFYSWQSNLRSMRIGEVHAWTTGRDVSIAIIDTGADTTHPELRGQIYEIENFTEPVSPGFYNDAHGTAVAGVISARPNNNAGIVGIAPDAKLSVYKACWPEQTDEMKAICNSFTLALAVNSAIRAEVDVLNLSLAGPEDPILRMLLEKAIDNGIVIVAADAGNDVNLSFPASLKHVIGVRSLENSSRPLKGHSVLAPGVNILTTLPNGKYGYVSGSSLASAQVSGIVALIMQIEPKISLKKIRTLLQHNESLDVCKFLCSRSLAVANAADP